MPRNKKETTESARRALALLARLHRDYPDAACSLVHATPLELLVATILSAQCTDERVNQVTPGLFRKYPRPEDYAASPPGALEQDIRTTGFFNNKAKSLRGLGKALVERHGGEVPRTMEELLALPGVARKTANVVLGTAFGVAAGITVDTHVFRLARRLGLSAAKTPEQVERDLMDVVPHSDWIFFGHALIQHGRRVCQARKPRCAECALSNICPSAQ
ncbi:MAG: endonuclease III [Planctomycetes bacterium]|nr:endonuclease III [Planctomycetota bacterium]